MEDGVEWIVAWYEFGGVMQISSACLRELPLFKMGIPPPLRLADVASDAKRRRSASTTIILPFVQSPSKFYDLIGEYRYSARETVQDERLRKFYGAVHLPDHFQPGCVDVQLEAEATPLHMTRHAMNLLEFMHGKHRFSAELLPNEYMPGVRRKTLELLLFDDQREAEQLPSPLREGLENDAEHTPLLMQHFGLPRAVFYNYFKKCPSVICSPRL